MGDMTARFEAFSLLGFLAFMASGPLIASAATIWPHWLIAPFTLLGIAGFVIWQRWISKRYP